MQKTAQSLDIIKESLKLIGAAFIGVPPSKTRTQKALAQLSAIKNQDGGPLFPGAVARLSELGGAIGCIPSQEKCRSACAELKEFIREVNAELRQMKEAANDSGMRPSMT